MKTNGLGIWLFAGLAAAGLCIGWGLHTGFQKPQEVTVKGSAEKQVRATQASWKIQFQTIGASQTLATQAALKNEKTVLAMLTGKGLGESEIALQAPRVFRNGGENNTSYTVESSVWISSQSVDKIASVHASSAEFLAKGIALTTWESPSYAFDALETIKPEMIAQATQVARKSAEQFAMDSDSDVGKILSANQGYFSYRGVMDGIPQGNQVDKIARVVVTIRYKIQ